MNKHICDFCMEQNASNPVTDNVGTGTDSQNLVKVVLNRSNLRPGILRLVSKIKGFDIQDGEDLSPMDRDLLDVMYRVKGEHYAWSIKDCDAQVEVEKIEKGTKFFIRWSNWGNDDYSERIVLFNEKCAVYTA